RVQKPIWIHAGARRVHDGRQRAHVARSRRRARRRRSAIASTRAGVRVVNAAVNGSASHAALAPLRVFDDVKSELVPALATEILALAAPRRSTASLNQGGWKSPEGAFEWEDTYALAELGKAIAAHFPNQRAVAWCMVNRAGSFHPTHRHQTAIVS